MKSSVMVELQNELFEGLSPKVIECFRKYHLENPHVYDLFRRFSWELKRAGRQYYGAQSICERIRWHLAVETKGDDFKINNNHIACYARLLIIREPVFEGFFELRTSRAKPGDFEQEWWEAQ